MPEVGEGREVGKSRRREEGQEESSTDLTVIAYCRKAVTEPWAFIFPNLDTYQNHTEAF